MTRTGGQGAKRTTVTTSGKRASTSGKRARASAPRARSNALPLIAKAVGIPIFALALLAGLLYVRLLQGPITLSFLVQPIETAIGEEMRGVAVRVENVALRLGEGHSLEFELKNVRVADAQDETLALAPSATIALSRKALLHGRFAPESVDLISPRVLVFYGEDGKLSLRFSHPTETAGAPASDKPKTAASGTAASAEAAAASGGLGRIDLIKALSDASARARRLEHASAYLREIGLKSATLIIDNGQRKSVWRVPELQIDLDHRRSRSSIAGRVKVDSLTGPWTLNFRTYEHESSKSLQLAVSVQGLVPRGLARTLPPLAALESLDVPVWGEGKLDLSNTGEILGGTIGIDAAPGTVLLPWLAATPFHIDGAHLEMSYNRAQGRFDIAPSVLVWGDSRLQFTGNIVHAAQGPDGAGWNFDFKSAGGWLGAEPPQLSRLDIDDWSAHGFMAPERGRVVLRQFRVRAGGADITAEGDVSDLGGPMKARLDGRIGPMPASLFKALWPAAIAPRSREWVSRRLIRGQLQGGTFRVVSGAPVETNSPNAERASLTLEGSNLAFELVDGWPLLEAPRALVRLDGQAFEMTVPEGTMAAPDGRKLALKGSLSVDMNEPLPRTGHIALKGQGPLALVLDVLDREPLHALHNSGIALEKVDGRVDAQVTLSMPLGQALKPTDITAEGKIRIIDGRLKQAFGHYDLTSANIAIDLASTASEAKGEMLINGVVAKVAWQHIFAAPPDKQPPMRITANLDDSYRTQLGLDINDIVRGEVGVDITVSRDAGNERRVHFRGDLANAEVILDSVAWHKPRGRAGVFEFDYVKGSGAHPVELQNVKLVGDNVALQGWMGIGADNKVKEFRFPVFSLNVITSLEAHGKVRPDGVWEVFARGPTYDGRDLFRSFFDVAHLTDPNARIRPGLDLTAEVDTVAGFSEGTMRNVRMRMQKRLNKIIGLDARGTLDGGKPFAAVLRSEPGQPRILKADAKDAGQLFKLVGFYPNALGGEMILELNLDGQGAADRTGTLWTRDFVVLGDPIVSEVLQSADGMPQQPAPKGRRGVVRERFQFEQLRVPFSVGHGQFVIHSAYINGPVVGATIRGKVDFRARVLDLGGTYIPLSGLNQILAPVPLLGPLLTGPRGEGMIGITFAIQGAMDDPQVIVNPLALMTPGIFREIMQMTPENPSVLPRAAPGRSGARTGPGTRASSSPPSALPGDGAPESRTPELGGSWSAETKR